MLNTNIKIARIKAGISQRELAEKIGGSLNDISRYETGRMKPTLEKLCLIANALNVTTDYLLGREE